ncbi:hypothetical protein AAVH_28800 [Aphelenchoides avenae]|nr:hypothetical protein AAVH_28800 [Aphelenchus avenae]
MSDGAQFDTAEKNTEEKSEQQTSSRLKRCLSDVLQEVCELARIRRGATIIFDLHRLISDDIVLSELARSPLLSGVVVQSVALLFGMLLDLFDARRKGHDGAAILRFFNDRGSVEPNIHAAAVVLPTSSDSRFLALPDRGTRHRSAVVTSHLTNSPILVTSEESGSITFVHRGKTVCFERDSLRNWTAVVAALLRLLLMCTDSDNEGCASVTLAERFITTHCAVMRFDLAGHEVYLDWYKKCFVDAHMQLYQSAVDYNTSLSTSLNSVSRHRIGASFDSVSLKELLSEPGRRRLKLEFARNAEEVLKVVKSQKMGCYVLAYGEKRLGGFMFRYGSQP